MTLYDISLERTPTKHDGRAVPIAEAELLIEHVVQLRLCYEHLP